MITSINTVMANSYRTSLKAANRTAFRGGNLLLKAAPQAQSPVVGIVKSLKQNSFLGRLFKF